MKQLTRLLFAFIVLSLITSCSIERRHYRDGFYIDRHREHFVDDDNPDQRELRDIPEQQTIIEDERKKDECITTGHYADSIVSPVQPNAEQKENSLDVLDEECVTPAKQGTTPADQPQPEKEAPNRTILILILLAIALVFLPILAILPLSTFLFVLVLCTPIVGVLIYLLAMKRRQKVLQGNISGEKGDEYRVSNYYDKFSLALHLFFGGALAGQIGIALLYLTELLGLAVGIAVCAITLCSVMFIFLLVMAMLYLFKWRRLGENRPKSWEKRPKEG